MNDPNYYPSIKFTVDPEHSGIRTAGCLAFLIGSVAAFLIINTIIPNTGFIAVIGAVVIGVGLTYTSDFLTKRYWPSKRYLQIVDDVIQLAKGDIVQSRIDATQNVNFIMWHFEASRHPRVPKGWYVVANALEQDGEYLVTYAIASPKHLENMPLSRLSVKREKKKKKDEDNRDLRQAGAIRRIEQAEFHRGELGGEMLVEDYQDYLNYLVETYTSWMPKDK